MNIILNILAVVNGVYDILCALSILDIIYIPIINELHISMIKDVERNNPLMKRFMAYWIFSYGIMRIYGGYNMNYTPLKNPIRRADEFSSKLPVTYLYRAPLRGAGSNLHWYKFIFIYSFFGPYIFIFYI